MSEPTTVFTPSTTVEGDSTTAHVHGFRRDDLEQNVIDQIQHMADHEAIQGDVRVMPDTHVGSGAVIGFTMPLDTEGSLRVVPNIVGVDIGCGVDAVKLSTPVEPDQFEAVDEHIRDVVPMGRSVHGRNDYHLGDEFPFDECQRLWGDLSDRLELDDPEWFDEYGLESYFKPLCRRVGYDPMRAINSIGTLGGGNHFVELDRDEHGDHWLLVHSGSRGIGLTIAEYWQDEATRLRTRDWITSRLDEPLERYVVPALDDPELGQWFRGGKGRSYIDSEAIKKAVNDNYLVGYLHDQIRSAHPQERDVDETLDYLKGQEAAGYLIDMIFAQVYARTSRQLMLDRIVDGVTPDVERQVNTTHNYIDPEDAMVRKGAVSAHDGESFVLPFNMADGALIATGQGLEDWNLSAPHGAGRRMSRTQAYDDIDMDEFTADMEDVYSTSVVEETLDEAPQAYKDAATIREAMAGVAVAEHSLTPVLNVKALE